MKVKINNLVALEEGASKLMYRESIAEVSIRDGKVDWVHIGIPSDMSRKDSETLDWSLFWEGPRIPGLLLDEQRLAEMAGLTRHNEFIPGSKMSPHKLKPEELGRQNGKRLMLWAIRAYSKLRNEEAASQYGRTLPSIRAYHAAVAEACRALIVLWEEQVWGNMPSHIWPMWAIKGTIPCSVPRTEHVFL